MQTKAEMKRMLQDLTQYIMIPSIKHSPELGTYVSYDIALYDFHTHTTVELVADVTADRNRALELVELFNRCQLSPVHLKDAIEDKLE